MERSRNVKNLDYGLLFSGFERDRSDLIPILQRAQETFGYLSEQAIHEISRYVRISENRIFGVASFYGQFRFVEPGRHSIKLCSGTACHVAGGHMLGEALERYIGVGPGETTGDGRYDFECVACLGCCALAPVVQVASDIHSCVTVNGLKELLDRYA